MLPVSTYRLQLQPQFGFDDAARILPYLKKLGITHVYASPYLQAAPASVHGYDVVDHARVNEELGGEESFRRFIAALKENQLGHILDIVPNHMAIPGRENAWWWDVLKCGIESKYADYFDIDWQGPEVRLHNLVLVPILGDHYAKVLERGELKLEKSVHGDVVLRYFENEFPVDESTLKGDIESINADVNALDAVIQSQHYRLAYWRVATDELDYRRFFDINTLVGLRMDRAEVFDATHARVLEWLRDGVLDGVRIDHVDGLFDPAGYLRKLRESIGDEPYVIVEKILKLGERLPPSWPVSGTTGYDLLAYVNGLFVEPNGEQALAETLEDFTGQWEDFHDVVLKGKKFVVDHVLRSDVERLTQLFVSLSDCHRAIQDYTRAQFRDVVRAMLIAFPVYRTYCVAETHQQTQADVASIEEARDAVATIGFQVDPELLDFFCRVLKLEVEGDREGMLAMRFQQATGAVMAKGMEDTAFYRSIRLVSLNEVGCDPGRFAIRPDDFHSICAETQRMWPHTMIASTTHDTKRSEDARYRLHVLSELPEEWATAVRKWSELNDVHKRPARSSRPQGDRWPSRHDEYLFYQTIVGAFPLSTERAVQYMRKASKEAKLETSWTEPNEGYDDALQAFVESAMSNSEFVDDVAAFVNRISKFGYLNSLSATVIKLTMPGVPDTYQGTELWSFTLVDPDNRQLIDYSKHQSALDEVVAMSIEDVVTRMADGYPKLLVTHKLLQLRAQHPEWFDHRAIYEPVWTQGDKATHVVAFRRNGLAVVAPRLMARLSDWGNTTVKLPDENWKNVFTGDVVSGNEVPVTSIFARFPVAVLVREGAN